VGGVLLQMTARLRNSPGKWNAKGLYSKI